MCNVPPSLDSAQHSLKYFILDASHTFSIIWTENLWPHWDILCHDLFLGEILLNRLTIVNSFFLFSFLSVALLKVFQVDS